MSVSIDIVTAICCPPAPLTSQRLSRLGRDGRGRIIDIGGHLHPFSSSSSSVHHLTLTLFNVVVFRHAMLPCHFLAIPGLVVNHRRIQRRIVPNKRVARQRVVLIHINRSGHSRIGKLGDYRHLLTASATCRSSATGAESARDATRTEGTGRVSIPPVTGYNLHWRIFDNVLPSDADPITTKLLMPHRRTATWTDKLGGLGVRSIPGVG
mmetsp:Transcript_31416/g.69658  ORF Transcript_31416/g.69658 Transcript_31416/m.69658 type:complete len:209 (-) Transcript_31416:363-989(-)